MDKGKLVLRVDTQLFRGVHYEMSTYDKDGNEWLVHSLKKAEVGEEIGLYFEPEAIHVMRLNETEEEFDKRLEAYARRMEMTKMQIRARQFLIPVCTVDRRSSSLPRFCWSCIIPCLT